MTTIKLVEEEGASTEVKAVYEDIKQHLNLDFVPNVFKAMAHNPQVLGEQWKGYKQAEAAWGKEMLYVVGLTADIIKGCDYCTNFDTAMLKRLGWDDAKIEGLVSFVALNHMYTTYVSDLSLETDVTPAVIERRMAA